MEDTKEFETEVTRVRQEIDQFREEHSDKKSDIWLQQLATLQGNIRDLEDKLNNINKRETDMQGEPKDTTPIEQLKKNIAPFQELWSLFADIKKSLAIWNETPINQLVPDEVRSTHKKFLSTANRLAVQFGDSKAFKEPEKVATRKRNDLQKFQKYLQVIEILCTEGLKPNHIEQMSTVMNLDPKTDCTTLNIKDGLPDDVEKHTQKLDEIADFANKQYENENYLKNMKKDW